MAYTGGTSADPKLWSYLQGIELTDPEFGSSDPVDLLLGADVYAFILAQGLRKGGPQEPVAQNTAFGWILSGAIGETTSIQLTHTHQCCIDEDLVGLVYRLWEQEELPSKQVSQKDVECEEHFARTHARLSNGRYVVRLPLVEPLLDLLGTRRIATRMLQRMEAKFSGDVSFRELYCDFMRQYAELEHMTPVTVGANSEQTLVFCRTMAWCARPALQPSCEWSLTDRPERRQGSP